MISEYVAPASGGGASGTTYCLLSVGPGPGKLGQGEGPGPEYVMHQFLSMVLRSPLPTTGDSSLMSKPMAGPDVREIWLGGFPAMTFRRMTLSVAPAWISTPLMLPPMLLSSMMLPLLLPTRPTPKSLLGGPTEPFPAK